MADSKELRVRDKQEVSTAAEQTRPGLVFTPDVDIYETDSQIVLLADMPGVDSKDLTIDLRDDILTISGDIAPFEGAEEEDILIEYETGRFARQFTLAEVIDQQKIEAKLENGVLRLILPKIDKATPRKITVTAG